MFALTANYIYKRTYTTTADITLYTQIVITALIDCEKRHVYVKLISENGRCHNLHATHV
jgi:hypothetical protein